MAKFASSQLTSLLLAHCILLPLWLVTASLADLPERHRHRHGDTIDLDSSFHGGSDEGLLDEGTVHLEHRPLSTDSYTTQHTGHCSQCQVREQQKEVRIELVKYQILKKLGMERPPNITGHRKIPAIPELSRTVDEYEMQGDAPYLDPTFNYHVQEDEEDEAEQMKILTASEPPSYVTDRNDATDVYFQLRREMEPSHVSSAKLHVYVRPSSSPMTGSAVLMVQAISPVPGSKPRVVRKKRLSVGGFYDTGEWHVFDIKSLVRHWLAQPESNCGLRLEVYDATGEYLALVNARNEDEEPFKPVLELRDKPPSRRRRDMPGPNICSENSTQTNCCRFPLEVDFEKFGWDWVIAPRRYSANYCSGKCGFMFKTLHRVSHIVQQSNRSEGSGPCCAPKKLAPLRLIYFDDRQQIIWGKLADMIILECACA